MGQNDYFGLILIWSPYLWPTPGAAPLEVEDESVNRSEKMQDLYGIKEMTSYSEKMEEIVWLKLNAEKDTKLLADKGNKGSGGFHPYSTGRGGKTNSGSNYDQRACRRWQFMGNSTKNPPEKLADKTMTTSLICLESLRLKLPVSESFDWRQVSGSSLREHGLSFDEGCPNLANINPMLMVPYRRRRDFAAGNGQARNGCGSLMRSVQSPQKMESSAALGEFASWGRIRDKALLYLMINLRSPLRVFH